MVRKLLIIIVISILTLNGCKKKDDVIPVLNESVGSKLMTSVVSRGDIYNLTTHDAKIYPEVEDLYLTIDGTVGEIPVYLGQEVKEGDILLYLDDKNKKEELARLEEELEDTIVNNRFINMQADLDIEMLELNMAQKVAEQATDIEIAQLKAEIDKLQLVKKQTLDMQEFNIRNLEDRINAIKDELKNSKIRAPFDGTIVYIKNLRLNERVSAYDTIFIIANNKKMHLQTAFISESDIRNASEVYAVINGNEYDVEYLPLTTDEILRMKNSGATIESKFLLNEDSDIKVGDYACIFIKEKLVKDVKYIPKNALYSDSDGNFVYRIIDGSLERINVEIGMVTDIQVEILSGLEEGDEVYVQGT